MQAAQHDDDDEYGSAYDPGFLTLCICLTDLCNIYIKAGSTLSVTVIVIGNGIGDSSSNLTQSAGVVEYTGCISAEE